MAFIAEGTVRTRTEKVDKARQGFLRSQMAFGVRKKVVRGWLSPSALKLVPRGKLMEKNEWCLVLRWPLSRSLRHRRPRFFNCIKKWEL